MSKNIVICCDGTSNEFGHRKSNVVKLYKTLICNQEQIAYYHPGVGTIGSRNALSHIGKWWTRIIGLAFGYGLSENVADAYQFLMRNFEPGDKVYIFGFSRGAYTARVLCGMLHIVGLLREGNEGLIPYAIRMIKKNNNIDFPIAFDFKKTFSRVCKPHFIGVWDTVSSVGWIYNTVHFPFTQATKNPDLNIVRHAVSIDERRAFFRANSFGQPNNEDQDVKEVLFAGVHSDVGGSFPEEKCQLSQIALRWMLDEAEAAGLKVDQHRKTDVLGGKQPYVEPNPLTRTHNETLRGAWWLAEVWPKVVSVKDVSGKWKKRIRINLARHRKFPPNPLVHESVEQRFKDTACDYHPKNLPEERRIVHDRPPMQSAVAQGPQR